MSKHDRLLHILTLLTRRRPASVAKLAEECGVSRRTIYRDIDTISRANYPIYYDNGYRLLETAVLPPPQFTPEELALLRAALDSRPLAATPAYRTSLKRIQAKLDGWYPPVPGVGTAAGAWPVVRPRLSEDHDVDPKLFDSIAGAITARESLDIAYESTTSGLTERRVDPYFLVFRGHAYYMVAWCRTKRDFRLFRLGRIRTLTLTGEMVVRQARVTLDRLFRGSWEVYLGTPFEATVEFRGRAARIVAGSRRHHSEKFDKRGPENLLYTVTVNSIEEFGRWVLGYGGQARVLSPPNLVAWMKTQAGEVLAAYRDR